MVIEILRVVVIVRTRNSHCLASKPCILAFTSLGLVARLVHHRRQKRHLRLGVLAVPVVGEGRAVPAWVGSHVHMHAQAAKWAQVEA